MKVHNQIYYTLEIIGSDDSEVLAFKNALETSRLSGYLKEEEGHPTVYSTLLKDTSSYIDREVFEEELILLARKFPDLELVLSEKDFDERIPGSYAKLRGNSYRLAEDMVIRSDFSPSIPFEHREKAVREEDSRRFFVQKKLDQLLHETDFDLLYAQKKALQNYQINGVPMPKEAVAGLVSFLEKAGDIGEGIGRFRYDSIKPRFTLQDDYKKQEYEFEEEKPENIFLFCEEMEDEGGIREFRVHGASYDEDELRKLLLAKVEKDEYGMIADNGLEDNDPNYVKTNFYDEKGFVEYYLFELPVLDKAHIAELLQTPDYETRFTAPSNLKDLTEFVLKNYAQQAGFSQMDYSIAANAFMRDPKFQSMVKQSWWGRSSSVDTQSFASAVNYIHSFVHDRSKENPEFFVQIGAVSENTYPDNLKDILMSSIYDVSRDFHLPVTDATQQVNMLMSTEAYQSIIQKSVHGIPHLSANSQEYEVVQEACYKFVKSQLVHDMEPARLDSLLSDAIAKSDDQKTTNAPDRPPHSI